VRDSSPVLPAGMCGYDRLDQPMIQPIAFLPKISEIETLSTLTMKMYNNRWKKESGGYAVLKSN